MIRQTCSDRIFDQLSLIYPRQLHLSEKIVFFSKVFRTTRVIKQKNIDKAQPWQIQEARKLCQQWLLILGNNFEWKLGRFRVHLLRRFRPHRHLVPQPHLRPQFQPHPHLLSHRHLNSQFYFFPYWLGSKLAISNFTIKGRSMLDNQKFNRKLACLIFKIQILNVECGRLQNNTLLIRLLDSMIFGIFLVILSLIS